MKTEKIRGLLLDMNAYSHNGLVCKKIRRSIMRLFESPNMMWSETSQLRKAARKAGRATEATDPKNRLIFIGQVDEILESQDW